MDRRESLKTLVLGGFASGLMLNSCVSDKEKPIEEGDVIEESEGYGRTPEEAERDAELFSKTFFSEEEMGTIAVLSDIIIPGDDESASATEAEVPEFIEFIVKDIPSHQLPMRGGLMWLNRESTQRYGENFSQCGKEEQLSIIDDISNPQHIENKYSQGTLFFNRMKNLVVTGYFTSKPGIEYLGYVGNQPNVWDGVPEDVLQKHGLAYDEHILRVSLKPNERNEIMDWENYESE